VFRLGTVVRRTAAGLMCSCMFSVFTAGCVAKQPVTIAFFHHWMEGREHLVAEVVSRFEQANPDIKVEQIPVPPGMQQRREKLFSMTAANLAPDVMMIDRLDTPEYAVKGIIAPLDPWLKHDKLDLSLFFPAETDMSLYNGSLWSLPLTTGSGNQIIYYNKDHFLEAGLAEERFPSTWPELDVAAKKLTQKDGERFTRIAFEPWRSSSNESPLFGVWLLNNGGEFLSDDTKTVLFGSREGIAAAEWVARFAGERYGGLSGLSSFQRLSGYGDFYQGRVTMWVHGPPFLYLIPQNSPELRFGTAVPPAAPGFGRKNIAFGGWAYAMSATTKHSEAAWRLLRFLTTDLETAGWFMQAQNMRPSPLRAVMNSSAYRRNNPHIDTFIDAMINTVAVKPSAVTAEILLEVSKILPQVAGGSVPAEQVVLEAAHRAQLIIDEAAMR
jgi:multiple sugar transport system substrate-binding protein